MILIAEVLTIACPTHNISWLQSIVHRTDPAKFAQTHWSTPYCLMLSNVSTMIPWRLRSSSLAGLRTS
jgi:hypothetical protein